ncbi:MAG TPA: LamG-like jellyroll fold domain-containing protein [Pyrinomonadaceae bacterium]|jgi:hypothetical protein
MKSIIICLLLGVFTFSQSARAQLTFKSEFNQNVNHGQFWEIYSPGAPNVLETDFAWEAWIKFAPETTLGYVVSSGYGAAHAILFGINYFPDLHKGRLVGNFTVLPNGVCGPSRAAVVFGSDYVFEANVWTHIAVASVNHSFTAYKDGQPIINFTWQGSRISSECDIIDWSAGMLYVGGSTHLNFDGEISQVRGWEGFSPYTGTSFTPQTDFGLNWTTEDGKKIESAFLAKYQPRKLVIDDLSAGYRRQKHPGLPHPSRPQNWK